MKLCRFLSALLVVLPLSSVMAQDLQCNHCVTSVPRAPAADHPLFLVGVTADDSGQLNSDGYCIDAVVAIAVIDQRLEVVVEDEWCGVEEERSPFIGPIFHDELASVTGYSIFYQGREYRGAPIGDGSDDYLLPEDGLYWNSQAPGSGLSVSRAGRDVFFVEIEKGRPAAEDLVRTGLGQFEFGTTEISPDDGGDPFWVATFGYHMLIVSRSPESSARVASLWSRFRPFSPVTLGLGRYRYSDIDYSGFWEFTIFGENVFVQLMRDSQNPRTFFGPSALGEIGLNCPGPNLDVFQAVCDLTVDGGVVAQFLSIHNGSDRFIRRGHDVMGVRVD